MTDKQYIQAFRENNQRVIREAYNTMKTPFKAFIGARFSDLRFAEYDDVYQDAIIRLQQNILEDKLNEQTLTTTLQSYLNSVGYYVAQEYLRQSKEELMSEEQPEAANPDNEDTPTRPEDIEDPMAALMQRERNEMIMQTVMGIGKPCAPILLGFYWENLSMEQLAEKLGYNNADTAKSQKAKCMKKLKNYLGRMLQ